ncbi:MAG: hypothetical protein Q6K70_07245, partial [Thermostichales cyanobacterium DRC_bins_46]
MTETVYLGILGSALASLGTGLGALPIIWVKELTPHRQGVMLGLGAGVMLAATAFSLILPGWEAAESLWGSRGMAAAVMTVGMVLGGVFLWLS